MFSEYYIKLKQILYRLRVLPLSIITILGIVNFVVLVLPLATLFFFRIYEHQLVAETEAEMISQSVFIAEITAQKIRNNIRDSGGGQLYGKKLDDGQLRPVDGYVLSPRPALNPATDQIYSPSPDGEMSSKSIPDNIARRAGASIDAILHNARKTSHLKIRVLDSNGRAIAGDNDRGLSYAHIKEVKVALGGHYDSVMRQSISHDMPAILAILGQGAGIKLFTTYPIISQGRIWGVVYLSQKPQSILNAIYAERRKFMLIGMIAIVLAFFISLITSWTIARPIYRLIRHTRRISENVEANAVSFDLPGTREMALLATSFCEMTDALKARSQYINQFAAQISHEFKTPLTSIMGAAELLDQHDKTMSDGQRKKFLANIIADTNRMGALVSRLLDLARADNKDERAAPFDVADSLKTLETDYSNDKFQILCAPQPSCMINISQEDFDAIISNLIENARQHHASRVEINLRPKVEVVELLVADNGDGISPPNLKKIFDPFFTTRRECGGTGLGLSIVRSLLKNYAGSIDCVGGASGACFKIIIPRLMPTEYK